MKIIADANIPYVKEFFSSYGELILKPGRSIQAKDVNDADILLVRSITHVNESLLANSKVKFVGSITSGIDHLNTHWLDQAKIPWADAAGFNTPPVADFVVSIIAALQRKKLLPLQGRAAVIGAGKVGQLVIAKLKLLGFEVIVCDPIRAEQEKDFHSTPIHEISDVDFMSLHVPLTRSGNHPTYHLINANILHKQKSGCCLLNTSRGSVIDNNALLQHGKHLQWCLDVWEHEPRIDKNLLNLATIATPHIAGYSVQSKLRGIEMLYHAACEKKIIEPLPREPLSMPTQTLAFAGENHHWQDIVLGIFNPLIMTAMMKTLLLPADDHAHLFDEMRNQFSYRNEFEFTKIAAASSKEDCVLLEKLGISSPR